MCPCHLYSSQQYNQILSLIISFGWVSADHHVTIYFLYIKTLLILPTLDTHNIHGQYCSDHAITNAYLWYTVHISYVYSLKEGILTLPVCCMCSYYFAFNLHLKYLFQYSTCTVHVQGRLELSNKITEQCFVNSVPK